MTPGLTPAMAALVRRVTGEDAVRLCALACGGNNRVFRVETASGSWLLKEYFRHPDDARDRLGAEYAFSRFAWDHGVRCIPRPWACDAANALGLYEYVTGRAPGVEDVRADLVNAALSFWDAVNVHRQTPGAGMLPAASEACFTLREHVGCLERRIAPLAEMQGGTAIQDEARAFVLSRLEPAVRQVAKTVAERAGSMGAPLTPQERCLSPSDFGFHNALLRTDGQVCFLDFEYAGWDDPAKMVCDFFCQPAVPVPAAFSERVTSVVGAAVGDPEGCRRRVDLLMPVYRLKWCCIMLNAFLPVGSCRRGFARQGAVTDEHKARQLQKAREGLEKS